ncbi:hypothetical protein KIN20_031450 [Parelaphostrongylus tenuis]|uniref:Uncharacterized protein n=1 Tax=Parelaphostrongylus tenuis TaxID=148309 RepID=A0AAD5R558_PARTN|nr:hypothetical protein KIN20_031450 [Parelaphostrongylus tenuis]
MEEIEALKTFPRDRRPRSRLESHPSTSQSNGPPPAVDDNWAGIDLGDLDLFTGASSKENEATISSVFELGGNLFPDSFNESPQKSTSFSNATMSQPIVAIPKSQLPIRNLTRFSVVWRTILPQRMLSLSIFIVERITLASVLCR